MPRCPRFFVYDLSCLETPEHTTRASGRQKSSCPIPESLANWVPLSTGRVAHTDWVYYMKLTSTNPLADPAHSRPLLPLAPIYICEHIRLIDTMRRTATRNNNPGAILTIKRISISIRPRPSAMCGVCLLLPRHQRHSFLLSGPDTTTISRSGRISGVSALDQQLPVRRLKSMTRSPGLALRLKVRGVLRRLSWCEDRALPTMRIQSKEFSSRLKQGGNWQQQPRTPILVTHRQSS